MPPTTPALNFSYCNEISARSEQSCSQREIKLTEHVKSVVLKVMDFRDVMLFSLVSRYQRFEINLHFLSLGCKDGLEED